jgi:SPP1 family predicted phage head-tail adaptor
MIKLKDKRIEILAVTATKDAEGFATEALAPIAPPLWAYFRQLSGKEIYAAKAVQPVEEALFVINWRSDVTPANAVRYRDVLYDITRVDCFEGYRGDISLYGRITTNHAEDE